MSLERILAINTSGGTKQLSDSDTARVGRIGAESSTGPSSVVIEVSGGATATLGASAFTLSSGIGLAGTGSPTITGFDSATLATKVTTPEVESTGGTLVFDANNAGASTMTFQNAGAGALSGSFDGDLTITGDLTVDGTQFIADTTNIQIEDNHLYLNKGYETVSAETGGLVVNYLPTATNDSVDTGGFTAGVDAVSDPTIATVGNAFAASDLVQVEGAADPENDGLYEVVSHAANVLTLRSTAFGVTNQVEDFTNNQLVTDATVQGTIRKVTVSILRAGTDGVWESGSGAVTGISFSDLATGGGNSLQGAYDVGQTITLIDSSGDLVITLDDTATAADFALTDSGGDYLRTDATNNSLDLGSSGAAVDIVGTSLVMTGNPTVNAGTGQWDFGGNVDANAGLDVSGSALTIAAGATHSSGEFLFSGGNLQLNDSVALTVGTGDDLTISHNGTDTTITSATGDLIIDNTSATGSTIIRLGTDTSATDFQVQGDDGTARFTVTGATSTTQSDSNFIVGAGFTTTLNGDVSAGDNNSRAITIGGGTSDIVSILGVLNLETVEIEADGTANTWFLAPVVNTGVGVKGISVNICGGLGSTTDGDGGDLILKAGNGNTTNGNGGTTILRAGNAAGGGVDGNVDIGLTNTLEVNFLAAGVGLHGHFLSDDDATGAGSASVQMDGGLYVAKTIIGDTSILADRFDAFTATTLLIGDVTTTKVEVADTAVTTEVQGPLTILGSADTLGAAAFNLAGVNATSLNLGASDIVVTNLGVSNFDLAVTMDSTLGVTGILTLASTLIGTDDGTGIIVGSVGTGASEGSALQAQTFTTTQRNFLVGADGMMIYNSTNSRFEIFDDGSWKALGEGDLADIEAFFFSTGFGAAAGGDQDGGVTFRGTTVALVREFNGFLDTSLDTFSWYLAAPGDGDNTTSLDTIYRIGTEANTPASDINDLTVQYVANDGGGLGAIVYSTVIDAAANTITHSATAGMGSIHQIDMSLAIAYLIEDDGGNDVFLAGSGGIAISNDTDNFSVTIEGSGGLIVDGDVAANGGDLTTTASTFGLVDTNATTINFGGGASAISVGASTSTVTIEDVLTVVDVINANGGAINTDDTTFGLLDTTATTINAFGAATTLEFGAGSGTTTIHNSLDVDLDVNIDGGDLTSNAATMNVFDTTVATINLGGAASAISMGAGTSTVTIEDNLAIVGDFDPTVADASKNGFTNEWSRLGVLGIGHRDFTNETGGASIVGTFMQGDPATDAGLIASDGASWTTVGGVADEIVADLAALFVVTGGIVSILVDATVAAITRWDPCYLVSTNGGGTAGRVSNDLSTLIPGDTAVCIGNFCATDGAPSGLTLVRLNGTAIETVLA